MTVTAILVVEDDRKPPVRSWLNHQQLQVDLAASGNEALSRGVASDSRLTLTACFRTSMASR
jgi:hypothetical protein